MKHVDYKKKALTIREERDRYKQALENFRDFCGYPTAQAQAVQALNLTIPLRVCIPRT